MNFLFTRARLHKSQARNYANSNSHTHNSGTLILFVNKIKNYELMIQQTLPPNALQKSAGLMERNKQINKFSKKTTKIYSMLACTLMKKKKEEN
jgi:hypothetical protein